METSAVVSSPERPVVVRTAQIIPATAHAIATLMVDFAPLSYESTKRVGVRFSASFA